MSQRYHVQHRYEANRDGRRYGPWQEGETIELAVDDAEWINRDSPDTLAALDLSGDDTRLLDLVGTSGLADAEAITAAVDEALAEFEQQRLADLGERQDQARALVDETAADPSSEATGRMRELAADLVAGVVPERAAGLAVLAALLDDTGPAAPGPDEAAAATSTVTPAVEEKPAAEAKAKTTSRRSAR